MAGFVSFVFILISLLSMMSGFLFLSMSTGLFRGSEKERVETKNSRTRIVKKSSELFDFSTGSLRKFGIALSGFGYTSFLIATVIRISALNII